MAKITIQWGLKITKVKRKNESGSLGEKSNVPFDRLSAYNLISFLLSPPMYAQMGVIWEEKSEANLLQMLYVVNIISIIQMRDYGTCSAL